MFIDTNDVTYYSYIISKTMTNERLSKGYDLTK